MSLILKNSIAGLPPIQIGPRCGEGLMGRVGTDCKPRANNRLFRDEMGVS